MSHQKIKLTSTSGRQDGFLSWVLSMEFVEILGLLFKKMQFSAYLAFWWNMESFSIMNFGKWSFKVFSDQPLKKLPTLPNQNLFNAINCKNGWRIHFLFSSILYQNSFKLSSMTSNFSFLMSLKFMKVASWAIQTKF